ncbi:MAG: hypothetical protein HZC25_17085 [Rhodospirillales bacterium]|nr:hypothetical protein [Rhodospirillales bacterium]
MTVLRRIDSDGQDAAAHLALGAALAEAVGAGEEPPSFRFFQCRPALLIGRHQPWIERPGLETARRLSGGGTVYVDLGQLCWELIDRHDATAMPHFDEVGAGLAAGLSRLGIDVRYRSGVGLETQAGKLGGVAGWTEGAVRLMQGTLFLAKASAHAAARQCPTPVRLVSLEGLLGRLPAIDAVKAAMLQGLERTGLTLAPGETGAAAWRSVERWRVRLREERFVLRGEIDGD